MSTAFTPNPATQSKTADYTVLYTDDLVNFVVTTNKTATLYSANGHFADYSNGAGQGIARGSGRGIVYISNDATSTANVSVAVASGEKMNGVTNGSLTLSPGQNARLLSNGVNTWYYFGTGGGSGAGSLFKYQQTCVFSQFTDGGGASGTLALSTSVPAGAVYARTLFSTLTGFTGNTSATATLGDGTDVDRYNTGTPDFFTSAAAGVDAGVPSGTLFHSAAKTPTLTVTGNSDFTLITAGSVLVTMFWYTPF